MGCIPQPIVPFPSVLARSTPSRSHYTTRHVVPGTEVPVFLPSGNVLACFVTSGCHGACVSANRYCCCHARNYTARHVVPGTRYSFFLHAGEFLACFVTTGNRLGFQGIDTAVHVLPGMLYQVLCFFSQYPVTTGHKRKFQGEMTRTALERWLHIFLRSLRITRALSYISHTSPPPLPRSAIL